MVFKVIQEEKQLGCRDPRYKHENPSVTVIFDKLTYLKLDDLNE